MAQLRAAVADSADEAFFEANGAPPPSPPSQSTRPESHPLPSSQALLDAAAAQSHSATFSTSGNANSSTCGSSSSSSSSSQSIVVNAAAVQRMHDLWALLARRPSVVAPVTVAGLLSDTYGKWGSDAGAAAAVVR